MVRSAGDFGARADGKRRRSLDSDVSGYLCVGECEISTYNRDVPFYAAADKHAILAERDPNVPLEDAVVSAVALVTRQPGLIR